MYNIGKHSYSYATRRGEANDLIIGNYCSIATGVIFDGGFNHESKYISTFPFQTIWSELKSNIKIEGRNINIGNDVWVGENAVIMSGVTIGDGAIIGYGSIISRDVAPYSVVVGANRLVRKRFTDYQIKQLIQIAWWNWEDEKIKENAHLLHSENTTEFINKHY